MFPPGAHSPQGTPAVQTTHFQFNSHQINLFLTYRKGLNTGLTPGQMPLATKPPGVGPPKVIAIGLGESHQPTWHLHIQSSSCINVNLMSTNKWTQQATTARCYSALPALCKYVLARSLLSACLSQRPLSLQTSWNHQSQYRRCRGESKRPRKPNLEKENDLKN